MQDQMAAAALATLPNKYMHSHFSYITSYEFALNSPSSRDLQSYIMSPKN